jgi:hypothetical protein
LKYARKQKKRKTKKTKKMVKRSSVKWFNHLINIEYLSKKEEVN